jgi:hypothetical protein
MKTKISKSVEWKNVTTKELIEFIRKTFPGYDDLVIVNGLTGQTDGPISLKQEEKIKETLEKIRKPKDGVEVA